MATLKKGLIDAYRKAGLSIPTAKSTAEKIKQVPVSYKNKNTEQTSESAPISSDNKTIKTLRLPATPAKKSYPNPPSSQLKKEKTPTPKTKKNKQPRPEHYLNQRKPTPRYNSRAEVKFETPPEKQTITKVPRSYRLESTGKISYQALPEQEQKGDILVLPIGMGCQTQLSNDEDNVHDVKIGLDFGTSSVKVVVSDVSIEKSFAVPFRDTSGLDQYLLPCRVWESRDRGGRKFVLNSEKEHSKTERYFDDLKLKLLNDPHTNESPIQSVIGFLALVLKHVRSWLFHEFSDIYSHASIEWTVAIGIPSESEIENKFSPVFNKIVRLAWLMSQDQFVRTTKIKSFLKNYHRNPEHSDDIEVLVIPELAAQIYGFVSSPSASFDTRRVNRYAIVDIGAGTVDSSVFEVKQVKGNWNFTYYTAVVQPNGVANLHSKRIRWWTDALSSLKRTKSIIKEMKNDQFRTDMEKAIPETYEEYVKNVKVIKDQNYEDIDKNFFRCGVYLQVHGKTIRRCERDNLLPKNDINGLPLFLCGGGSRMLFYNKLPSEINSAIGDSWLKVNLWSLSIPSDLICDELDEPDYDRLSVAYGLSRLHLGQIDTALPLPKLIDDQPESDWGERYVGKDQV